MFIFGRSTSLGDRRDNSKFTEVVSQ